MMQSQENILPENSSILVVGGAGYVGSALCSLLEEKKIKFALFDNFNLQNKLEIDQKRWTVYEGDVTNPEAVEACIAAFSPTHVVHLAAIHFIPYCEANPAEATRVNVLGLQHVIDAIRHNPQLSVRLLFASSAAVYNDSSEPLSENDAVGPLDIYGETKRIGEHMIASQLEQYKIVRLFNVYGDQDPHQHVIPRIYHEMTRRCEVLELGNIETKRDYIHVSDVASAIHSVLFQGRNNETYNVGTGRSLAVNRVIDHLSAQLEYKPKVISNVTGYKRTTDRMNLQADISKILSDTAWRPKIAFAEGLQTLQANSRET